MTYTFGNADIRRTEREKDRKTEGQKDRKKEKHKNR
jgi:hypothetical protein